ncbi:uncharacterized protein MYCFIDRAFT_203614, partial [Pseudocercospora fijiensis CIRAD86]
MGSSARGSPATADGRWCWYLPYCRQCVAEFLASFSCGTDGQRGVGAFWQLAFARDRRPGGNRWLGWLVAVECGWLHVLAAEIDPVDAQRASEAERAGA